MGSQFAVCFPDKDLIYVQNADDQGKEDPRETVIEEFFNMVVNRMSDAPLPEDPEAQKALSDYVEPLVLQTAKGEKTSDWAAQKAKLLHKAEELLMQDMPVIPVVFNQDYYLMNKKVISNVSLDYFGGKIFKDLKMKDYKKYLPVEE